MLAHLVERSTFASVDDILGLPSASVDKIGLPSASVVGLSSASVVGLPSASVVGLSSPA